MKCYWTLRLGILSFLCQLSGGKREKLQGQGCQLEKMTFTQTVMYSLWILDIFRSRWLQFFPWESHGELTTSYCFPSRAFQCSYFIHPSISMSEPNYLHQCIFKIKIISLAWRLLAVSRGFITSFPPLRICWTLKWYK